MTNINDVTVPQLRKVISIRKQIDALEAKLAKLTGKASGNSAKNPADAFDAPKKRRKMSAAGRAKMAAAARKRWRKAKAAGKNRL